MWFCILSFFLSPKCGVLVCAPNEWRGKQWRKPGMNLSNTVIYSSFLLQNIAKNLTELSIKATSFVHSLNI